MGLPRNVGNYGGMGLEPDLDERACLNDWTSSPDQGASSHTRGRKANKTSFKPGHSGFKRPANKIHADLKNGIITAATNIGRDGAGAGGLVGYLEDLAVNHKKVFAGLMGRLIPLQVGGQVHAHIAQVNVVNIPRGRYLSPDEVRSLSQHATDVIVGKVIDHEVTQQDAGS